MSTCCGDHHHTRIIALHLRPQNLDVTKIDVPVIGGHAGGTILPLLSQVRCAAVYVIMGLQVYIIFNIIFTIK